MIELKVVDYPAAEVFLPIRSSIFPHCQSCRGIIPDGYLPMMQLHHPLPWYGLRGDGCMLPEISVQS